MVGNGGGLGEQNVSFASMKFAWLTQACWSGTLCQLTEAERSLRLSIMYSTDNSNFPPLVFESGESHPEHFRRPGRTEIRRMNTMPSASAEIFINIDKIYEEDSLGNLTPISVKDALLGLLVEIAYQRQIPRNQIQPILDKVSRNLSWPAEEVFIRKFSKLRDVNLKAYRYDEESMTYAIADGNEIHDIDAFLQSRVMCLELADFKGASKVKLRNIRWRNLYRSSDERDSVTQRFYVRLPLLADISYQCNFDSYIERYRGQVEIEFGMRFLAGSSTDLNMGGGPVTMQYFSEGTRVYLKNLRRF